MKHQRVCTKNFLWGGGWRAGCVCMRGVAGTGWRWWSFHLFAHTIDSVIKRCEVFSGQRLIVTRFSPDRLRHHHQSSLNSHKYVDSPASRPIVSRGERRNVERRDIANFWVNQQLWEYLEMRLRKKAVYEEARISEKKKRKDKRIFLHAHLCSRIKIYEAHIILLFLRSQRIFLNCPSHTFFT